MSTVIDKNEILEMVGGGMDSFTFQRRYGIHLIPITLPHLPKGVFGLFRYQLGGTNACYAQSFFMSYKGKVEGMCHLKEITAVIRLGEALERRYKDQGYQVIDIQMPLSYGFTGTRYGFRQTRDLFPDLA